MRITLLYVFLISIITPFSSISIDSTINKSKQFASLNNILLIIHYNHPYYESIDFIKTLYKKAFPHIVFYGEKKHPQVKAVRTKTGWYAQNVLLDAIQTYPGYDGYLMLQDDCLLNFWNITRFDTTKIWANQLILQNLDTATTALCPDTSYHTGWQWVQPSGQRGKNNAQLVKTILSQLPYPFNHQITDHAGINTGAGGWSDCVYIPQRLAQDYCTLCPYFNDVFIEIALPTMFVCLDNPSNIESMKYVWGSMSLNPTLDWTHPVKFSSPTKRQQVLLYFSKLGMLS